MFSRGAASGRVSVVRLTLELHATLRLRPCPRQRNGVMVRTGRVSAAPTPRSPRQAKRTSRVGYVHAERLSVACPSFAIASEARAGW